MESTGAAEAWGVDAAPKAHQGEADEVYGGSSQVASGVS